VTESLIGSRARVPWFDRLRVLVIAAVIVAHTATAYLITAVGWYYEERGPETDLSDLLMLVFFPLAVYGLAPLFMLGGWLSEQSLTHRDPSEFARSRLLRLGVPLVVYFLLIDPLADYLGGTAAGETRSLGSYLADLGGDRDVGPVWFIAALLVFSLVLAAWRSARRGASLPRTDGRTFRMSTVALLMACVAAADFVVWQQAPYLDAGLWSLQLAHWPQAAGVFVLGVTAFRRGWFDTMPPRTSRRFGWATLLGLAGLTAVAYTSTDIEVMLGGLHWQAAAFAVLDAVTAVSLCLWVAGVMGRHWNRPLGPWTRRASRGSYAAYLLHPLVLVGLSAAAAPAPWPPGVKFLLVAALGIPASFLTGYVGTRLPFVRSVL
jgi:glucan biosynthesis protein C